MFDTDELHAEVEELFGELQEERGRDIALNELFPVSAAGRRGRRPEGFRVFSCSPVMTPERAAEMRATVEKYDARMIRQRLLAGERIAIGGRGRPPSRWMTIAAELGITLPTRNAPEAANACEGSRRPTLREIRQRLLAGERPKIGGRGRPPTRWIAVAKELGIEISGEVFNAAAE